MKRIFLALTFVASCIAASAQVKVYRLESVGENEAYVVNVPTYIRTSFETTYPGMTYVVWQPTEELWRATYLENNRVSNVYYTSNGDSYRTSLPVLMTYVPEEIVTDAINKYGTP